MGDMRKLLLYIDLTYFLGGSSILFRNFFLKKTISRIKLEP